MKILALNKNTKNDIIKEAIHVLEKGGVVVYPTETCYGIGVDATNQEAVDRLFQYKGRREGKPLSIAVHNREQAETYAEVNDIADNLYNTYLPGPITVVSKYLGGLAKGVASEFGTIGIRIPNYQLILDIAKKFGKPITATSANVSYKPRPYSVRSFVKGLSKKQKELIDLVLDAGDLPKNPSSTVVDTTMNNLNVMREGELRFNEELGKNKVLLKANTKHFEETRNFGGLVLLKKIDSLLDRPLILALSGELGAGKTQFAKGVAKNLGIKEEVTSPTYTIIDEYDYEKGPRKGKFVHADLWRVENGKELDRIGLERYLKTMNVIVIEWVDKFYSEFQKIINQHKYELLNIKIDAINENEREIIVYEG